MICNAVKRTHTRMISPTSTALCYRGVLEDAPRRILRNACSVIARIRSLDNRKWTRKSE